MNKNEIYCSECGAKLKDFEIKYNKNLCEECALKQELDGCEASILLMD